MKMELLPLRSIKIERSASLFIEKVFLLSIIILILFGAIGQAQDLKDKNPSQINNPSLWNGFPFDHKSDHSVPGDFTLLGQWKWGMCWGVAMIDSNHIIIGNGALLQILNISDRTHPVMVSEIEVPGGVLDIAVNGIYAYAVGENDDLDIIDLGDLDNPTLVSHWTSSSFNSFYFQITYDIRGLPYLYLGGTWFTILDISNPSQPQVVADQPIYTYIWQDMEAYADSQGGLFVYAPNSEGLWLEIFDVTDPLNMVSYPILMPNTLGLCVVNDLLYIGSYDQIRVFSLLDPQSPSLINDVQLPPIPYDLATDGEYLYAGLLESDIVDSIRVMKLDLSDPTNPALVDSALWPGPNPSNFPNNWLGEMVAYRQELIVSSTVALWGIDFDNPGGAETLFYYPTAYRPYSARHYGEMEFIASGPAGLWILDISDLSNPQEIGHYTTSVSTKDVVVEDTIAYLLTRTELLILNVSDPALPNLVSSLPIPTTIKGMEISEHFLYIPGNQGLIIVDVSYLYNPQIVNIFPPDHLKDVDIQDSLAFVVSESGLHIFNISNPTNPIEIGAFTLWGAMNVKIAYPYVYAAISNGLGTGFSILDISNPADPIELSRRDSLWNYVDSGSGALSISNSFAYFTGEGTKVIDIRDKLHPTVTATIESDLTCEVLQGLEGSDILVFGNSPGIRIYRHDFITGIHQDVAEVIDEFRLYQNYPNPFNPMTTIEFFSPKNEKVTLVVFNVLGQKVKKLLNARVNPGKHQISFDASELSSGVYYYRLTTPEISLAKKMVILQ